MDLQVLCVYATKELRKDGEKDRERFSINRFYFFLISLTIFSISSAFDFGLPVLEFLSLSFN